MEFGPVWRAMMRNKGGYFLIAVQIAVTMAVMVNAFAIMQERSFKMGRPSGLDEANTFALVSVGFKPEMDSKALISEDLDLLRNTPGVINAVATNSYPLRQGGWSEGLHREPGVGKSVSSSAIYFVDEHGLETFGLNLIDGRNFSPEQVSWDKDSPDPWPATVIITQALGEDLYPDHEGSYVGKTFWFDDDNPANIVGVVERLQAPWPSWTGVERSMLVPLRRESNDVRYVVRTEPGYRDQLMLQVEESLANSSKDRIIRQVATVDEARKLAYLGDAAMIKILTFVISLLTAITGLGIVGLASFSVARRTRQIGIRRALGATRPAIVRYFMLENFLVSSIGIVSGAVLAVGLNMFMVQAFSLTPLAWYVVPVAMIILWIVGQVAVAGPARKASGISPAIATRSI
ncbi:MAG: FtsX-like permease family protein [Gammaproteobacteria bacterium]|nr:FtsX-like permease family protein [Gammaproteobacteria bacterium]MDH5619726.1 FtsX-like permease family protein [Gammaproteobacteria bacterium]